MSFVHPHFLWALSGLLVPLAIHLWSNKEGKVIKIGSLQFLKASDSSRSRSVRLNEYLLLLLRMTLLALLVFILAEPRIKQKIKNTSLTYIIEPSLLKNKQVIALLDTIKTDDAVRALLPKFPNIDGLDRATQSFEFSNYWQLAIQMENLNTDSIVVFTKGFIGGVKGIRPTINKPIEWIVIDDEFTEVETPVLAYSSDTKIELILTSSSTSHLLFNKQEFLSTSQQLKVNKARDSVLFKSKSVVLKPKPELKILISYHKNFADQLYYLEAAIKAISKYIKQPIQIDKEQAQGVSENNNYSLVIWLNEGQCPNTESTLLCYMPDKLALNSIQKSDRQDVYFLTRLLTASSMRTDRFTEQLLKLLIQYDQEAIQAEIIDKRTISNAELAPNFSALSKNESKVIFQNVTKWLWILFLFLLIVERMIAKFRKQ